MSNTSTTSVTTSTITLPATPTRPVIIHVVSASTPVGLLTAKVPVDDEYLSEFHFELDTKLRTFTMRLGDTIRHKLDWTTNANLFDMLRDCRSFAWTLCPTNQSSKLY